MSYSLDSGWLMSIAKKVFRILRGGGGLSGKQPV